MTAYGIVLCGLIIMLFAVVGIQMYNARISFRQHGVIGDFVYEYNMAEIEFMKSLPGDTIEEQKEYLTYLTELRIRHQNRWDMLYKILDMTRVNRKTKPFDLVTPEELIAGSFNKTN